MDKSTKHQHMQKASADGEIRRKLLVLQVLCSGIDGPTALITLSN